MIPPPEGGGLPEGLLTIGRELPRELVFQCFPKSDMGSCATILACCVIEAPRPRHPPAGPPTCQGGPTYRRNIPRLSNIPRATQPPAAKKNLLAGKFCWVTTHPCPPTTKCSCTKASAKAGVIFLPTCHKEDFFINMYLIYNVPFAAHVNALNIFDHIC